MSESATGWELSRRWASLAVLCTSPLAVLIGHVGGFDRGFTAWGFGIAIAMACKLRWDLKGRAGFWVAVFLLIGVHTLLVVYEPWHYSGAAYIPIAVLDIAIDVAALTLLSSLTKRKDSRATTTSGRETR
jgi:hypothetical protein